MATPSPQQPVPIACRLSSAWQKVGLFSGACLFGLIAADDARLHLDQSGAPHIGVCQGHGQIARVHLQPVNKERRIPKARISPPRNPPKVASGFRYGNTGQHQRGLMKRTNKVLPCAVLIPVLPPRNDPSFHLC
jgi:hypothetical protein